MCGIYFSLLNDENCSIQEIDLSLIQKRGPDSFQTLIHKLPDCKLVLLFAASVLSLRGNNISQISSQPLVCPKTGNVLLWNGEIFSSSILQIGDHENDTTRLFEVLNGCNNDEEILRIFESIGGPYAFVYLTQKSIYFGRDRFGRRSLLISVANDRPENPGPLLTLSSVKAKMENQHQQEFQELKANGIYKIIIKNDKFELLWYPWDRILNYDLDYIRNIKLIQSGLFIKNSISPFNEANETPSIEIDDQAFDKLAHEFYQVLKESVARRLRNIPDYCKLCAKVYKIKFTPMVVDLIPGIPKCNHSKLAVLFSGGIDSAVLAALADQCLPQSDSIDLLNVAFEMPGKDNDKFLVPDRKTGIESLKELNPKRKWNFVQINITLDELRNEREAIIKHLLYPHQTVLDDSIGCALWFASRGNGLLYPDNQEYSSPAEVLLLGMGADEQLAGYSRHRARFENQGQASLIDELKMDIDRISERNLGRDDRILSDHGKESRLPYLDEEVVSYLNRLKIFQKCDLRRPRGIGEKYLLRHLGKELLGLTYSSRIEKRAIQFGSRVAKAENSKEKANERCQRII